VSPAKTAEVFQGDPSGDLPCQRTRRVGPYHRVVSLPDGLSSGRAWDGCWGGL
jgi:hypothetical protein